MAADLPTPERVWQIHTNESVQLNKNRPGHLSSAAFDLKHKALLSDNTTQFAFEERVPDPEPPSWLEPLAKFLEAIAPYFQYIFWAGVLVVVALILYAIALELMRRLPATNTPDDAAENLPVPDFRPSKNRATVLLAEADRLASLGRFEEAVRVLLHRSIEDMETAYPNTIYPAMTSREIQMMPYLSSEGRNTFAKIARFVEASLFAGRALTREQFMECRSAYEAFAFDTKTA